jgi:hypothetical protein
MDYFSLVRDDSTGVVFLLLSVGKEILSFTSTDKGATWKGPTTLAVHGVNAPTVGHGIQLVDGSLVVPAVCNATASCSLVRYTRHRLLRLD